MTDGVDVRVVAERVAEVVNRKLAKLHKKIEALESRMTKLELDVTALRSQTIESIVRSVLTIKIEDIASAIAVKVVSEFREPLREVVATTEGLRDAVDRLGAVAGELEELKKLPETVVATVRSSVPEQLTAEEIRELVRGAVDPAEKRVEELTGRINELMKLVAIAINRTDGVAGQLKDLVAKFSEIKGSVEELQESVRYVSEVSKLLEERLRGREAEEEEEEGEEE